MGCAIVCCRSESAVQVELSGAVAAQVHRLCNSDWGQCFSLKRLALLSSDDIA
jgi:hypothetical protein